MGEFAGSAYPYRRWHAVFLLIICLKRLVCGSCQILLYKSDGMTFSDIAEKLAVSPSTVRLCISKYYEGGVENALFDTQRPGRPSEITDDAKAWMINLSLIHI